MPDLTCLCAGLRYLIPEVRLLRVLLTFTSSISIDHAFTKMSYGRRLVPVIIDEAARDTPTRVYASIPRSQDLSDGFEDITYKRFANAINRAAVWLDSALEGRGKTGVFAYTGPKDLRYTILTVAAVKSGREVRGTGSKA